MPSDLGAQRAEVQRKADAVLAFWFDTLTPEQHFTRSDAVDAAIRERFAGLHADLVASAAAEWRNDPQTLLAAVIVLDQFSRNLFRGQAGAFAADSLALELARSAIARGWDAELPTLRRQFLYMPLMHAEDAGIQAESVRLFEAVADDSFADYARRHAEVIERFGRYPSRNAALGRETTSAERAWLNRPDAGW